MGPYVLYNLHVNYINIMTLRNVCISPVNDLAYELAMTCEIVAICC
jgi:hypothetical protein